MLSSAFSDGLYVFKDKPRDYADALNVLRASAKGGSRGVLAAFQRTGQFYDLKMLGSHTVGSGKDKFSAYHSVAGIFGIYPMRYQGTTYLSINERISGLSSRIDYTHWHVIAKYLPDFRLVDVCYFEGPRDNGLGR